MTINLTREDFEQAIKSGTSVFEGNTIPDTGKPSGRYYRFIRVPLAYGEHKVDALYGQRFYGIRENKPVTFNQEIRFLCLVVDNAKTVNICKKNIVDVTLCNKSAGNMQIKIPLDNFLYYEPKTKEIFVNICDICEGERKKVNRYVKDCGFFVRENLVPMMLVQRFEA